MWYDLYVVVTFLPRLSVVFVFWSFKWKRERERERQKGEEKKRFIQFIARYQRFEENWPVFLLKFPERFFYNAIGFQQLAKNSAYVMWVGNDWWHCPKNKANTWSGTLFTRSLADTFGIATSVSYVMHITYIARKCSWSRILYWRK